MNSNKLKQISNEYQQYILPKEAGFFQDWGKNTVGGLRELFVRPVQAGWHAIKTGTTQTASDVGTGIRDWWHRYVWDPDDKKFSKLEQFLAGSDYDRASDGGPVRVTRADGTVYWRARTPADTIREASKRITADTKIRDARGKITTIADDRNFERNKWHAKQLKKITDVRYNKMRELGYPPAAIARMLHNESQKYNRNIRSKRDAEYNKWLKTQQSI